MNRVDSQPETIELRRDGQGRPFELEVTRGAAWSERMQAGPFIFNVLPQIVIWSENERGELLETLYVTGAGGEGFRHATKNEKGAEFYRECFPVWAARMAAEGMQLPGKEEPYPDSLTSATPSTSFTLRSRMQAGGPASAIYLEINKSDDVNEVYTKENNDWAGQPSLIYRVKMDEIEAQGTAKMVLIGHGGKITGEGRIHSDMSGISTAKEQVEEITVSLDLDS
jgi:hypothetical protein